MFAVLRIGKIKTIGDVTGIGHHNERSRTTRNADQARGAENVRLAGTGDWCADVQRRLAVVPTIRTNAVLAIDHVLTASPDFFTDGDPARLRQWTDRSMDWLRATYGAENVVAAVLHQDEQTPHIQALVVPIDARGRLNARGFIGGERQRLAQLQDSYHAAVADLGLERGVRGSVAEHQTVRAFYAKIQEPTPARELVLQHVAVERPGRLVSNPERYASAQEERIADRVTPAVDAALTKARAMEERAAVAEANVQVLQGRVRALERDCGALAAQVREVDLRAVMQALGGAPDRYDRQKWDLGGEHISLTGATFYNHERQQGGGGAIDLVMHATGYDVKQSIAYLRHELGVEQAAAAGVQHLAPQMHAWAAQAARPPFQEPTCDPERWPQVHAYLTQERHLPAALVDDLHRQGLIYADRRANAVFLRRDPAGHTVGAALRGTGPGSTFKGLAPGSRRDAGHFQIRSGQAESAWDTPRLVLVESPIDALSYKALKPRDRGGLTIVATDGAGALPQALIAETLAARGVIRVAFDNDRAGEGLWQQLADAYPGEPAFLRERPAAKDWNLDLCHALTTPAERDRDDGRGR